MGREHDNDTGTKTGDAAKSGVTWRTSISLIHNIKYYCIPALSKPLLLYAPVAPTLYPFLVSWHLPPYTAGAQPIMAESPNIMV
jgi:hypothetical protein